MRTLTLVIALALLSGCQVVYGLKDNQRLITYTAASDVNDVAVKCDQLIANWDGCARVTKNTCEIVAMQPRTEQDFYRFMVLGHELWHCLKGGFHGQ